ncbi:MAG: bifunctional adenosylcobinamide kinase/adenosylcobinamide-phosphate guanylyltransferase [Pseudobutyrivibrio sp.]|nr:bifunctional adenosylcobinamide kinase/adenosylcobinamide-phosphate guanylyltransferase [Pseudobutyrivibrio sp.]
MVLIIGGSYQGKTEYARENFPKAKFFNQAHLFIKKRIADGKNQQEILEELLQATKDGDWVIIADEIGNGVVPMDEADRVYRETTGRILIDIAREATEVHRVILGLGQRIK